MPHLARALWILGIIGEADSGAGFQERARRGEEELGTGSGRRGHIWEFHEACWLDYLVKR